MSDNTAQIQALLNQPGDVRLPAGVFTVGPMKVPLAASVSGDPAGTTLILKDFAGDSARILTITRTSDVDTAVFVSNLILEGNRSKQGWQGGHDLEHQGGIFLWGKGKGRLKAKVRDVVCNNWAGDGIYCYHGIDLDLQDFKSTDIFRGAWIAVAGSHKIKNLKCVRSGIILEPNNEIDVVKVQMCCVELSKFNCILKSTGEFVGSNITYTPGVQPYVFCNPLSKFTLRDSQFSVNSSFRVRIPGQTLFERVSFQGNSSAVPVLGIEWIRDGYTYNGMKVELNDCKILGPGSHGIYTNVDYPTNKNSFICKKVAVEGTKYGILPNAGRKPETWLLENCTHNGTPIL